MDSRQKVRSVLHKYQRLPNAKPGFLGNGAGLVDDSHNPGYVYVRIANAPAQSVINKRCASINDLPVWVGYDPLEPNVLQILTIRSMQRYGQGGLDPSPHVGTHGQTHRWFENDTVFVDLRQMMPFRPSVDGSMILHINRGITILGGQWQEVVGQDLDMTSYIPSTGAVYSLVYYGSTGTLNVDMGTVKDLNTLLPSDAPIPTAGTIPIALIRMYGGMDGIVENRIGTDLADPRWTGLFGSHAPVTLDTNFNAIFSLMDQELGVDSQAINKVLASPATGSAGPLTVRALVTNDLANKIVTLAKLDDMATASLYYRKSGGAGAPEVNTLATLKTDLGSMPASTHAILDSTYHSDTLTGSVLDGAIIIGNVTPKWSALAIAIPAANVRNVLGIDNGETRPSWKTALDATNPATLTAAGAAAAGTSLLFSHIDHAHAITSSSNPGAAAAILASTAGGLLTLVGLTTTAVASLTTPAESWIGPSATTGIYFSNGGISFGVGAPILYYYEFTHTYADPITSYTMMLVDSSMTMTADNANNITAMFFSANIDPNGFTASNTGGAVIGVTGRARIGGTTGGTITRAIGVKSSIVNAGNATITDAISFLASPDSNSGGGAITNNYGLYIPAVTIGTNIFGVWSNIAASGISRYNIYAPGTALNYFAGNVGIGAIVPVSLTELQGGLTTVGAILTLSSKETSTVANDILGRINFRAALDASGTDAILTGASIAAIAEATFSASVNQTGLQFSTGASEVAVERVRIDHLGNTGFGCQPAKRVDVTGDIQLNTAGNGLYVKEGTNATMGKVTLVLGVAVVSTTKVTADSRILLTTQGGTLTNIAEHHVSARTAGTSFTITSMNLLDTSDVGWVILEPA